MADAMSWEMNKRSLILTVGLLILAVVVTIALGFGGVLENPFKEIGRTTEKELNVVLSSSFGSVHVSKGESEKIFVADVAGKSSDDRKMDVAYDIRNRVGYLDLTLGEAKEDHGNRKGSFKLSDFGGGKWYLKFSDNIPISFDVELGVGNGDFDLSGLRVKDFTLSTGASDVSLSFDEPNETTIDNLSIESGVSKFNGRNLGNANFKRFKFQGGVGAYTLDFSGDIRTEVDADIEVGLGVLTIIIPENVGAKVFYEKSWVSRLDCDRDFHTVSDDEYETENYESADGKMNIRIDSGLGSVNVRHK
jgi:hypothetical protein